MLVGEDGPVPAAGAAAGGDPAAVDPVVDAGGGHAELGGQARDGPLARVQVREDCRAALGVLADSVLVDDVADLLGGEDRGALGRPVPFGVQRVGDLPAVASLAGEPGDAVAERGVVRELVQPGGRADGFPAGLVPAGPGDAHVHDLAVALDGHGHVVDEDAEQFLAVGPGGRRGVPDRREVPGQGLDRVPLGGGQDCGLLRREPLVVALEPADLGEGLPPSRPRAAGCRAASRVGELVLTAGPVRGVAGALDALPPQLVRAARWFSACAAAAIDTSRAAGTIASRACRATFLSRAGPAICWRRSPVP